MLTFIIINTKVIIKTCIVYITFKIDSLCSQVYISNTESVHIIDNFLLNAQCSTRTDVLIWHSQSQEQKRHKMGIKKFQIILPYPTKTYIPGETVAGQLQIELDDTKKFQQIKILLVGEAHVHWTETRWGIRWFID